MQLAGLVKKVRDEAGLTQAQAHAATKALLKVIEDTLVTGETIELRGFGTFKNVRKKPRNYSNPRTGEKSVRPQTQAPRLNFSSNVRRRVRDAYEGD